LFLASYRVTKLPAKIATVVAGDVMKQIFSVEKRYVDGLHAVSLTNASCVPAGSVEALFQFSPRSRKELKDFIEKLPPQEWYILDYLLQGENIPCQLYAPLKPRLIVRFHFF
jgi:hypothetical protein